MTADIEANADSEERSQAEASLEFGMSEALLRHELRAGRLERIAHRSGIRVRRVDVAILAASPQLHMAQSTQPPVRWPRTRQSQQAATQADVLRIVGELGEASISQVQQRLTEGGVESTPYLAVGSALRELTKEGKLAKRRDGHRLLYHLRTKADDLPPPPSVARPTPRPRQRLPLRANVSLTTFEEVVLEAIGKLGKSNLGQLYRALTQPAGASYPEFVLAVRGLVQRGLVIRIQERNHYFYRVWE